MKACRARNAARRPVSRLSGIGLLALAAVLPIAAQDEAPAGLDAVVCEGRITDSAERPAVGYRVVFRVPGTTRVTVSEPSSEEGAYSARLPGDAPSAAVALIAPDGKRIELPGEAGVIPVSESRMRYDIQFPGILPPAASVARPEIAGVDRLFLSFVEDVARERRDRWEASLELADGDTWDRRVSSLSAAYQIPLLPQVELGFRTGYGSLDLSGPGGEDAGMADTDVWMRLEQPGRDPSRTRWGLGAVLTLPTGDEDAGLGQDAFGTKLFATMRREVAWIELSGHVGLQVTEDGEAFGVPLDGEVGIAAGLAALVPVSTRGVAVAEIAHEGERFAGADASTELLLGLNWALLEHLALRGAVGFGLSDGAPDSRFVVGFASHF